MRNSSMSPPRGIDPTTHRSMSGSFTTELVSLPDNQDIVLNLNDKTLTAIKKAYFCTRQNEGVFKTRL